MSQSVGLNNLNRLGASGLSGIETAKPATSSTPLQKTNGPGEFSEMLKSQIATTKPEAANAASVSALKFSAHAIDRLKSRGISFDQETLRRLENAVDKAATKGSKESLILTDDSALIVSVKNKTVITAMDRDAMKENVFTNIDSTVII